MGLKSGWDSLSRVSCTSEEKSTGNCFAKFFCGLSRAGETLSFLGSFGSTAVIGQSIQRLRCLAALPIDLEHATAKVMRAFLDGLPKPMAHGPLSMLHPLTNGKRRRKFGRMTSFKFLAGSRRAGVQ